MGKMFAGPIVRTTVTADVCNKIATHLMNGYWQEGERFPSERDLGRLLGVGRASLREALKALEIMGLIEDIHAKGNTIILVTHEEDIAKHAHRIVRMRDGLIENDYPNPDIQKVDRSKILADDAEIPTK